MAGAAGERTRWTPYIIYALAAAQAALGTYNSAQKDDQKALQALDLRVSSIEATMPLRSQMRDLQLQEMAVRVQRLEERRR